MFPNVTKLQTLLPRFKNKDDPVQSRMHDVIFLVTSALWAQSLDTDVQRPFYYVATVALLPY